MVFHIVATYAQINVRKIAEPSVFSFYGYEFPNRILTKIWRVNLFIRPFNQWEEQMECFILNLTMSEFEKHYQIVFSFFFLRIYKN